VHLLSIGLLERVRAASLGLLSKTVLKQQDKGNTTMHNETSISIIMEEHLDKY